MTTRGEPVATDPLEDYDPLSREVQTEPWAWYRRAQRGCPVHRHVLPPEEANKTSANPLIGRRAPEFYSLFRFEDVRRAAADNALFLSKDGPGPEFLVALNGVGMLLYADEPVHHQQRRIVSKALSPRAIAEIEPRIREIAAELVDAFAGRGSCDLASEFAELLPGRVFAEIFGVSSADHERFKRWVDDIVGAFGGDEEAERRSIESMGELAAYFLAIISDRRAALAAGEAVPDDLLSGLLTAEYDGKRFDDTDMLLVIHILLAGGHETTSSALGNIGYLFATHPEQLRALQEDRSLIPNAVEEVLRYDAPIAGLFRTTAEPCDIEGVEIPEGAKVRLVWSAANRDPEAFENPDTFDIHRDLATLRQHMAFGFGIHGCVGMALARLEMTIAIETLLDRLGTWQLDPFHPPERGDNLIVRRFDTLPLVFPVPDGPSVQGGSSA